MQRALVASILVHAAVLAGARPIAAHLALLHRPEPPALEVDRWTGTSIEVSTGVEGLPPGNEPASGARPNAGATRQTPDPASSNTASPVPATPPPPKKPRAGRVARPKPRPRPAPSASAAASTGAVASTSPISAPSPSSSPSPTSPTGSASPASSVASVVGAGSGSAAGSGTFGSEGKVSVRDLGRAFTRAIPAACSADPAWGKLAAGDAGTLRAELHVDAEGHLTSAEPLGESPPKHLVNILRRTVPLLTAGTFAVQGSAVTAGIQTLEIKAVVSDEPGGDEPGAQDRLAFSYEGGHGKASFTQSGGRRVDVSVRVVSVKPAD